MQQLSNPLRGGVNGDRGYKLNPHLSLLYKEMPYEAKAELARTISIPFQHISFDRLQVIAGSDRASTRSDVESWQTLAARDLTPTAQHSG